MFSRTTISVAESPAGEQIIGNDLEPCFAGGAPFRDSWLFSGCSIISPRNKRESSKRKDICLIA